MTEEQIQENRRKAVEHLRTTELPQGKADLYRPESGEYCALGHAGLAAGVDAKFEDEPYEAIEAALGMDFMEAREVWRMNDGRGMSLREIGDYLAAKWGIA